MARRSRRPLNPKGREVLFFQGDWERLTEILAPRRIKPGTFIRAMVAKIIQNREAAAASVPSSHIEVELEGLEDE